MKDYLKFSSDAKEILISDDLNKFKDLNFLKKGVYGKYGKTVLHYAVKYCTNPKIPKYCIRSLGMSPKAPTKEKNLSVLHICCKYGKLEILKYLVSLPKPCIEYSDNNGNTPLILAAKYNYTEISIYLHSIDANIFAKNNLNWTPIHWASRNGNYTLVDYFIQAGALPGSTTIEKENCLHLAAESGNIPTIQSLIPHVYPFASSNKGTLLHHCHNNPQAIDFILSNTQWKTLPKLITLFDIQAPLDILFKYSLHELKGHNWLLLFCYDRDDLIREMYNKNLIGEDDLEIFPKCFLKKKM
jgi:Ankyrin repeats (3 copies)